VTPPHPIFTEELHISTVKLRMRLQAKGAEMKLVSGVDDRFPNCFSILPAYQKMKCGNRPNIFVQNNGMRVRK
jgi:hypothetical protein